MNTSLCTSHPVLNPVALRPPVPLGLLRPVRAAKPAARRLSAGPRSVGTIPAFCRPSAGPTAFDRLVVGLLGMMAVTFVVGLTLSIAAL